MPKSKAPPRSLTTGYCMKCQQMVEMVNPEVVELKNGQIRG